jgi:hypothetical protein
MGRNWPASELRTKKQLVRDSTNNLPKVVEAKYPGHCTECGTGWSEGARIRRSSTGWMHARCTINTMADADIHQRMSARREALKAARSQTAH